MAIKIIQYLCPRRHCLIGLGFDEATTSDTQAQKMLDEAITGMKMTRRCGLCFSTALRFEIGVTKFASLAEASVAIIEEEKKNLATRRHFENLRRAARNN